MADLISVKNSTDPSRVELTSLWQESGIANRLVDHQPTPFRFRASEHRRPSAEHIPCISLDHTVFLTPPP